MNAIEEISDIQAESLSDRLLAESRPLVLRGFVKKWPLVKLALKSDDAADTYLRQLYNGSKVVVSKGSPEIRGRVFYNNDMTGVNIEVQENTLDWVLEQIKAVREEKNPPLFYVGSTTVGDCLPEFEAENALPINDISPLVSIWLGNQSRIAAHYDLPDNIACVAVGKRKFTLFPPEQLENLYVGPLDFNPAGQSISMVDPQQVDFKKYPKYRAALESASEAVLEPGDAIFIPSMWWHQVESLSPLNVLINYWWRQSPAHMGAPIDVLSHALLTIRDLPAAQRNAWKNIFDYYVFNHDADAFNHIPEHCRGVLGSLNEVQARHLRSYLINRLNR